MKRHRDRKAIEKIVKQHGLDAWFSKDMVAHMECFTYERGEHVFHGGDPLTHFYFFVKGSAKVYTLMENGKSYSLRIYRPLEVLGDAELSGPRIAECYVQVIEPVTCIGVPLDVIDQETMDDPVFLKKIIGSLADKLNQNSQTSSINLLYPLENRLASYLMAIRHPDDVARIVDTYADLATLLGTSYRHLSRTLTAFENEGLIRKRGRSIFLLRPDILLERASDNYHSEGTH